LPDLFAGKLHAILCRKWKTRVKGRDWYDLVWYAGRHPEVRISHLDDLDVEQARREVAPFVVDQRALDLWSRDFFRQIIPRIVPI
jgi:hypothetical protein